VSYALTTDQPVGWPRPDLANHRERCVRCGVGLGAAPAVRLVEGEVYHPICHDPPARPPADEVRQFWDGCLELAEAIERRSPGGLGAAKYLSRRGLLRSSAGRIRLLPSGYRCPPWARYRGRSWAATGHRLIVPVYDHAGRLALVRGWRWEDGDSPKRLAAAGCSVKGLVMAAGLGLQMLRGELPEWLYPALVLVVEGEPDTLRAGREWPEWCVLGIAPGCWIDELASRVPAGARVLLRTDADEAGDRYAIHVAETLKRRCDVRRAIPRA
jgi:hypothetical protein